MINVAIAIAMGCSSTPSEFGDDDDDPKNPSSSGVFNSSPEGGTVPPDACSAAAQLVYVVSEQNELHSFNPAKGEFKLIGKLDCEAAQGFGPNSMAVDRSGTAWINYEDGTLFKASTENAKCTATSFEPNQAGFLKFGMAFVSEKAGSANEALFISGLGDVATIGKGFGRINQSTLKLTMIGDYSPPLSGRGAELTGTGEGKLFGFFATDPQATLAQVTPAAGATADTTGLTGVQTRESWAFSFWGGDFWFYTSAKGGRSSVQRLALTGDKQITVTNPDVGFAIVGAGVSTCAPTEPPK